MGLVGETEILLRRVNAEVGIRCPDSFAPLCVISVEFANRLSDFSEPKFIHGHPTINTINERLASDRIVVRQDWFTLEHLSPREKAAYVTLRMCHKLRIVYSDTSLSFYTAYILWPPLQDLAQDTIH